LTAPFLTMKDHILALLAGCPALAPLPVPDLSPAALHWTVLLTDFPAAPRIGYDLQSLATSLGLSLQAWLNRAVGRRAAELLLSGDFTVGNLATTLGFDDESNFSRFIKKKDLGIHPRPSFAPAGRRSRHSVVDSTAQTSRIGGGTISRLRDGDRSMESQVTLGRMATITVTNVLGVGDAQKRIPQHSTPCQHR